MHYEKKQLLMQIFSRLCFHYGAHPDMYQARRKSFVARLEHYPEDLICACYQHLLRHQAPAQLPNVDDFIAFIMPEYERRTNSNTLEAV